MTMPATPPKNRKFFVVFAVLLALFLVPLVTGLFSGSDAPAAAPPAPEPPKVDLQAVPGTGTATGFGACAVLTPDLVAAAGLTYASEFTETTPEPGRTDGVNSCGGPLKAVTPGLPPMLLLAVADGTVTGSAASHGIRYERHPGDLPDEVAVEFGPARLLLTGFSYLTDGETVLAKLIDGVAGNLAAGPKPPPGYRYPAPYDLPAKPCDSLPIALFTTLTAHPTDGTETAWLAPHETFSYPETNVKIKCVRASKVPETVTVMRTIYRHADAAANGTKFLCENEPGWTAPPVRVGDGVGCATPGTDHRHQIAFHAGREMVVVEYRADHPPAGDLDETVRQIYALLAR
jgi:hypothetical protein